VESLTAGLRFATQPRPYFPPGVFEMTRGWAYGNEAADGRPSDPLFAIRPRLTKRARFEAENPLMRQQGGNSTTQVSGASETVEHRSPAVGMAVSTVPVAFAARDNTSVARSCESFIYRYSSLSCENCSSCSPSAGDPGKAWQAGRSWRSGGGITGGQTPVAHNEECAASCSESNLMDRLVLGVCALSFHPDA
jgi:hypothetical protein